MALNVSSWVKSTNNELVPVCQPNHALPLTIQEDEYMKLTFFDDLCLDLCWEYFRRGYECLILDPQFDSTIESFMHNLFNFKFSFRELKTLGEEKNFTLKRTKRLQSVHYLDEIILYVISEASPC